MAQLAQDHWWSGIQKLLRPDQCGSYALLHTLACSVVVCWDAVQQDGFFFLFSISPLFLNKYDYFSIYFYNVKNSKKIVQNLNKFKISTYFRPKQISNLNKF
jgi:hypothetical protein